MVQIIQVHTCVDGIVNTVIHTYIAYPSYDACFSLTLVLYLTRLCDRLDTLHCDAGCMYIHRIQCHHHSSVDCHHHSIATTAHIQRSASHVILPVTQESGTRCDLFPFHLLIAEGWWRVWMNTYCVGQQGIYWLLLLYSMQWYILCECRVRM